MPKKKLHWKQNRHSLTRTVKSNRVSMRWKDKSTIETITVEDSDDCREIDDNPEGEGGDDDGN